MPASRRFCPATGCSMLWKGSLRDRTASLGGQPRSILAEPADVQHSRSVRLPRSSTLCLSSPLAEHNPPLLHDSTGEAEDVPVIVRPQLDSPPSRHHADMLRPKQQANTAQIH